ncbi:carbohydrate ABC transporter permease [Cohnella rhizosphaerae]|uniref:Sugar ABC transporter permease n=1 Tax=Cohnella rhizosphaerae TaxID=1457232 RepID=A0A9X4QSQ0_9BACL|nr:sugar ABC transporter permease [Cohnella rhizosphaerae]MDG0809815.1 sugar ABC transporter permease [Cohnella rhizosphaerae]
MAICTAPALLLFLVFFLYPILRAFTMAFYRWSGMAKGTEVFIGFDNFRTMFHDDVFWRSLQNSFVIMLVVPAATVVLALFLAVLLTRFKLKERMFYRTVIFFPNVLSVVVTSILWSFIYHPTMGILKSLFDWLGWTRLADIVWLGTAETALYSVAVTIVWAGLGFYLILFIAGIESIPQQYYEASAIDGAGQVRQFFSLTLPLLWGGRSHRDRAAHFRRILRKLRIRANHDERGDRTGLPRR